MPIKKTHQQFVEELSIRNGIFSPLILVNGQTYESTHKKLKFICINNHTITMSPHNVLRGMGCKLCSMKRVGVANTNSFTDFLSKLKLRNQKQKNKIYLKSGQQYSGTYNHLEFECEHGHTFKTIPKTILRGHGCPSCGIITSKQTHKYTHEQFVSLVNARNFKFPLKKIYVEQGQTYMGYKSQMWFICDLSHRWKTTPDNILNGKSGCPYCDKKSFSLMAIDWLTFVEHRDNITIQHAKNEGEFLIPNTKFKADGFCKETNTIYEFHGDAFHGNPSLYETNEHCHPFDKELTAGELHQRTLEKEQKLKDSGYVIVSMWESDWKLFRKSLNKNHILLDFIQSFPAFKHSQTFLNCLVDDTNKVCVAIHLFDEQYISDDKNYFNEIWKYYQTKEYKTFLIFEDEWIDNKSLILNKINHYLIKSHQPSIHARQCIIKLTPLSHKTKILTENHIQGNDNASISIGAYYHDNLVAIMTFSKPRVAVGHVKSKDQYKTMWELSRFVTDTNFRIPGIASKLLTYFKRNFQWTEIYSYADKRWSIGNLYHKLGFELTANNGPDYFYVIDRKRRHRWNYRKDILKNTLTKYDPSLTEYQNMTNHGYKRVWGCGTLKFSIKN